MAVICLAVIWPSNPCLAQTVELRVPTAVIAGSRATIATAGTGEATFYVIGPSHSVKRKVRLGQEIQLQPDEVRSAGRYLAILCLEVCQSADFYVTPGDAAGLSFLVHPSRVPVRQSESISGTVFPFDKFHNLLLAPVKVDFRLMAGDADLMSRSVTTQSGVAWFRTHSGKQAGSLQVVAVVKGLSVHRVVQQVASDPCDLRVRAQRTKKGISAETEPVRDCSGNPVPDGTIVSFSETDARGTSTVDAPIKQGVARAQMTASGPAVISAASGVVMGNELRLGAQP